MIEKTKENANYNSITKIIKVVKQVFNVNQQKDDEDEDMDGGVKKGKKKDVAKLNIASILNSA